MTADTTDTTASPAAAAAAAAEEEILASADIPATADIPTPAQEITAADYRQVFGLLPTGVVAITGLTDQDKPMGFVVGTFQSLSLDPPLVTFRVDKSSSTWPTLRALGRFTANILSTEQLPVCKALSHKGTDKFAGLSYQHSPTGTPRIDGATAWIDCEVVSEVVAGDHFMIVGSVQAMVPGTGEALLFRGGKFGECNLWPTPAPAPQTASQTAPHTTPHTAPETGPAAKEGTR